MRFFILKDYKITDQEFRDLEREFGAFIKKETGLTPVLYVKNVDYTHVPTEKDGDGDLKPTKAYTKKLMDEVHKMYGDWGVDSVVMLVHRDNWIYTGIWGTNWSNLYHTYHVHLCRFDNKNLANSVGTLYHEWMHSLDALIKTHTGFEIDTLFAGEKCFIDWDTTCVHGNRTVTCKETPHSYIKWKENVDALRKITPHLIKAYDKRKEMYYLPYTTIALQFIAKLRALLNKKNGVSPSIKTI